MFDRNQFKRSVKNWMNENEEATIEDLQLYCEQLIPTKEYVANKWLIDETLAWYDHILHNRKHLANQYDPQDELKAG